MSTIVFNPYAFIKDVYQEGMNYVSANLPPITDTDGGMAEINETIFEFLAGFLNLNINPGSGSTPSPQVEMLFSQVLPNAANDYMNLKIVSNIANANLNGQSSSVNQLRLISSILSGINNNTYDSLDNFFVGVEEQIACSKGSNSDKASIFIAASIARGSAQYWNNILEEGPGTPPTTVPFQTYLNTTYWPVNYNNLSSWVSASFLGALSGFSQLQSTNVKNINVVSDVSNAVGQGGALLGAIGLNVGKLILSWPQGPQCC